MLIVYPFCSMFQYILNNTPFYLPICQLMGIWVGFCFSLGGFVLFLCLCFCFCVLLLWIAFIYKFLCGHMFYIFLGIYLRVKSYGISGELFEALSYCFPWLHYFTFSVIMFDGSGFSTSLPKLIIVCLFYYGHLCGCKCVY